VLGRINFVAPLEASGTDAVLVGASIVAQAEAEFTASVNATSLLFQTGASETATTKMILNSAGNVGIGGVLNVHNSYYRVLQLNNGVVFATAAGGPNSDISIGNNAYFFGGSEFRYIGSASNEASQYSQFNGTHLFRTAAAGTVGNAITWNLAATIANDGDVTGGTAGSWALQNEASSAVNPTLCPAGATSYGIGGTTTSVTMVAVDKNCFTAHGAWTPHATVPTGYLNAPANTLNTAAGAATYATAAAVNFGIPTLTATNAVTATDCATLRVAGVPVASTNVTITNPWALWVDAGNVRLDGIIAHNGTMGDSAKNPTTDAPADWVECKIGASTYYIPVYAAS